MAQGILVKSVKDKSLHPHYDVGICHESVEKVIEMNEIIREYDHTNIDEWYENSKLLEGEYIHTFQITIGGKRELVIKRTGKKIKLSSQPFNHSFLVLHKENKLHLCDAWEFIHPFTCRKKSHTLDGLYNILQLLLKVSKNEISNEEILQLNQYFNDDNQGNWEDSIQLLIEKGEDAGTYGVLNNLENVSDIRIVKFNIKTLRLSHQCGASRKRKKYKKKTYKKKVRKTRKIKRKTGKSKL